MVWVVFFAGWFLRRFGCRSVFAVTYFPLFLYVTFDDVWSLADVVRQRVYDQTVDRKAGLSRVERVVKPCYYAAS